MDKVTYTIEPENPGVVDVEILDTVEGIRKVTRKRLSFNDFLGVINHSIATEKRMRIGKIPNGLYDVSVDTDGEGFYCLIVVKADIKPFTFYNDTMLIPFPTLIFSLQVKKGVLKNSRVFALPSDDVSDFTELYHYPFGNVYESGRICWGGNVIKELNTLRDVEVVLSTFFGSSTNDDLWKSDRIKLPAGDPRNFQRGLIESLKNQTDFPVKILNKTGQLVKDLIKEMEG